MNLKIFSKVKAFFEALIPWLLESKKKKLEKREIVVLSVVAISRVCASISPLNIKPLLKLSSFFVMFRQGNNNDDLLWTSSHHILHPDSVSPNDRGPCRFSGNFKPRFEAVIVSL